MASRAILILGLVLTAPSFVEPALSQSPASQAIDSVTRSISQTIRDEVNRQMRERRKFDRHDRQNYCQKDTFWTSECTGKWSNQSTNRPQSKKRVRPKKNK
jgi:hypothetical protein